MHRGDDETVGHSYGSEAAATYYSAASCDAISSGMKHRWDRVRGLLHVDEHGGVATAHNRTPLLVCVGGQTFSLSLSLSLCF